MNWRRWTGGRGGAVVSVLVAMLAFVVCVPVVLAFPYKQQIGATTIRSEVPIDSHITTELARADALLTASPIDAPVARDIYLTTGGWRWSLLALTSRDTFAFRRPLRDAIIVNRSDVANDRVYNGGGLGGVRTLSGVIAHETTHILLAHHFGEFAMLGKPTWKQEGYADYVAQESSLSAADVARLRASGMSHPALLYYDGRRRVAATLAANGRAVDRLVRLTDDAGEGARGGRVARGLRVVGAGLLFLVVALALAIALVPHFLDRAYYRGPVTAHFDGARFANPDGDDDTIRPPTGTSRGGFILRYLTHSDARPPWPDRVVVHPVDPPTRVMGARMVATWVGHASVLVQTQGLNILTDPVWSDVAGAAGIGPHRVALPGIAFDRLPKIDVVLVSHDHYDHMDLTTLRQLWDRDRPLIVTSLGNDSVIGQAGVPARALDWGGRIAVKPGVEIVVTRNHHWGTRTSTDRDRALWSSFVVRLPGGNVFFAGDTGPGDMKWPAEAAAYGPIRFAMIPIGAFRFVPGQMGIGSHIGPVDAVEVYRRLGATRAMGIHWGTFRLSYEAYDTPPKLLRAAMACTGERGFGTVALGRPTEVPAYAPPRAVTPMPREALLRCLDTPAVRALR